MRLIVKVFIINFILIGSSFCGQGKSKTRSGLLAHAAQGPSYGSDTSTSRSISVMNGLDSTIVIFGSALKAGQQVSGMISDNTLRIGGHGVETKLRVIAEAYSISLVRNESGIGYIPRK